METRDDTLERIAADVGACTRCRLSQGRTRAVPGEGSPNAEVMFIGEGPGFYEDQEGRPFVGAAGKLLSEMLRLIGLRREDVFITNVVRSRPPGNRDPQPDELAACDVFTLRQIAVLKPRIIVTLGRFSMARFFGPGRITQLHGTTTVWNGITCLAMFHPAAILRAQSGPMRATFEEDFRKLPVLLEKLRRESRPEPAAPVAEPEPEARPNQLTLF